MAKFILIFLGGGLGSLLRYQSSVFFSKYFTSAFPVSTFVVNAVGCFFIGLFYGISLKYDLLSDDLRLFLIIGFCGGFTTFSAFAYENVMLLQNGNINLFILYTVGSFAITLLAVLAGLNIIKLF